MADIEHFAVYAADTTSLRDFYVNTFGMKVVFTSGANPPAYFLMDGRGMAIEIIARPPGVAGANQRWVCHLAFWVDDFAATHARLEATGVRFEAETFVDNDTMKTAFFDDPEGNRLQIVWRQNRLGS